MERALRVDHAFGAGQRAQGVEALLPRRKIGKALKDGICLWRTQRPPTVRPGAAALLRVAPAKRPGWPASGTPSGIPAG
jgi:hypothetical protein